jgi:hypothetical protein
MNKQWIDTCMWTCVEFTQGDSKVPTGMTIRFSIKNNTHYRLTLTGTRVHVHLDGYLQGINLVNIGAPLAPGDKYRVSVPLELTPELGEHLVNHGLNAEVVGCTYFTDTFGEQDSTLFGRLVFRYDGETKTEPYRTALASRWERIERGNPVMLNQQKKKTPKKHQ